MAENTNSYGEGAAPRENRGGRVLGLADEAEDLEELEPAESVHEELDIEEIEELEELDLLDFDPQAKSPSSPIACGLVERGMARRKNGHAIRDDEIGELEELNDEAPVLGPMYGTIERDASTNRKMNSFVPDEFIRLMGKKSIFDLKLGDHIRREMTVFFSDIRQFTELFESISPEEGFKFINSYFTRVVPVINRYGGFVDKYIGDAIMAIFPQSNGADMAVRASVEIQRQFQEYNKHRAKSGYRPLNVGIGLHTGMIILGVVGTHNRMQNTIISDAVNLASRIEGLTKTFGVAMAISGQTFRKLEHPEKYIFRYLGNVRVRGKTEPTSVYEILNGIDEETKEKKIRTSRHFEQGLFSFALKKYADALDNFASVLSVIPEDRASTVYIERCQERLRKRA